MGKDNLTYSFLALKNKLHQSAMGFLRDDEDARDVLQDTFLNLWKSGSVNSESEAKNKLFAVLRNLCIDRLRKKRAVAIEDFPADTLSFEPDFTEDMRKYETLLLKGLTSVQHKIYMRVVHDGMDYEEIASLLDMTADAVRMNMCRARKKVRDNYKRLN